MIGNDDPWVIRERRIQALADRLRTFSPERLARSISSGGSIAEIVHQACVRIAVQGRPVPRLADAACADQWLVIAREAGQCARADGDDIAAAELDAVMEHLRSIT